MEQCCIVCNVSVSQKEDNDIFADYTTIDEALSKLLSEIVSKPLGDSEICSQVICKQCQDTCLEYDVCRKRMLEIKSDITNTFESALSKRGLDYNVYPKSAPVTPKKLVLPASKLHPLPPNYVIDVTKFPKNLNLSSSPMINLKVTVGSTVLTQSIKSTQSAPNNSSTITTDKAVESNIADSLSSILGTRTSTSISSDDAILTFNVNSLPKDFLKSGNGAMKEELVVEVDDDDDLNNDMEIDEECTITKVARKVDQAKSDDEESSQQYLNVSALPDDGSVELNKLQILSKETGDDEEGAGSDSEIVMRDSEGSVLRFVMSGQEVFYGNGHVAAGGRDEQGQDDEHDSDEVELQVSGDEETANAIIAAAHEQGGAFIKVESGEMFRVKSVTSQPAPPPPLVRARGGRYSCLLCRGKDDERLGFATTSADDMMQHLRSTHDARLYICQLCDAVMRKRADYHTHLKECRAPPAAPAAPPAPPGRLHACNQCERKFMSRTLLHEHMNTHKGVRPYQCECGKTFASKYTHQAHLKTHQDRPRPYKCKECSKSFLTPQNLAQHEKTHLGIKDFVCNICGKAFGTQHNLEVHGVVHTKAKPFVCGVCAKPFARRAEVKDHMRIHTGERPFSCDVCAATFTQRSNLNSHRRATHLDDRRYHCQNCPKKFKRRRLLEYHIKVMHTGERPLTCEICHATFVYPEHYKKHARIHSGERPFVCEVCGKSFNSRDNRNTHRFVHSDKKPYECLVCGAGFMRKQLLYAHMNTSGHLAESIVVNQPRVQKFEEATSNPKQDKKVIEMLFEAGEELELSTNAAKTNEEVVIAEADAPKYIIQDGKTGINIVQETDDSGLLTFIQNFDESGKQTETQLEQVQMVTTDETGAYRVVQLHIGANPTTWMVTQ